MDVEEGLLLDGVALDSADVAVRDVEFAGEVEADFADSGLAFGDGTLVSAGVAAQPVAIERFHQFGSGFANLLIQDFL
jgi:hypothetical protein